MRNLLGVPGWFLFFFWDVAAGAGAAVVDDGGKECCCWFIWFGSSSLNPKSDAEEDEAAISIYNNLLQPTDETIL